MTGLLLTLGVFGPLLEYTRVCSSARVAVRTDMEYDHVLELTLL